MNYPQNSCIVEVKRKSNDSRWTKAMFYMNGNTPTFSQYGSQIFDVVEWRPPSNILKGGEHVEKLAENPKG